MSSPKKKCVVIGAGISGLIAARTLQENGFQTVVLDKGRGVGGRMATRRIGSAVFDHGTQFFTARSPEFIQWVKEWTDAGSAKEWSRGFLGESHRPGNGYPRFRGELSMTAIPKHLSLGLDVRLSSRVTAVEILNGAWLIHTESGDSDTADALLVTAPVPQALAILGQGGIDLPAYSRKRLEQISYEPCIAMLVQPKTSLIPSPGGLQLDGNPISWIADNRLKGISPCEALTIHAGPEFSRSNWDSSDAEIVSALLAAAKDWIEESDEEIQIHRWRFAKATSTYPEPCLKLDVPLPLVFAGDAFGAPRVEGAALSGLAAAHELLCLARE